MSQVRDFEVTEARKEALQIYSFLCYLPFGSAAISAAIINNKLEGPTFRNGLRLLREEINIGEASLSPQSANKIKRNIAQLDLDETRISILRDILDYLTGCMKAFSRIAEWLSAENIITENFTGNLRLLHSA